MTREEILEVAAEAGEDATRVLGAVLEQHFADGIAEDDEGEWHFLVRSLYDGRRDPEAMPRLAAARALVAWRVARRTGDAAWLATQGRLAAAAQDHVVARRAYEQAFALEPEDHGVAFALAEACSRSGDPTEATRLRFLAAQLADQAGERELALRYCERLLQEPGVEHEQARALLARLELEP